MLFAAGMGIGLMFFGVSEPLSHFGSSFGGIAVENGVRTDWAPLGAAAGDAEAVFAARHGGDGLPLVTASLGDLRDPRARPGAVLVQQGPAADRALAVLPLLGERVWGWPGHIVDILAVLATLFGLATSLGFGAAQASAGLNFLFDVPLGNNTQILLVIGITAIALMSVVAGWMRASSALRDQHAAGRVAAGIRDRGGADAGHPWRVLQEPRRLPRVSARAVESGRARRRELLAGLDRLLLGVVDFLVALRRDVHRPRIARPHGARVHRLGADRSSLACVLWMTVFGETAITQFVRDGYEAATKAELPLQLFMMLEALPLAQITSFIAIVLVVVFFVTVGPGFAGDRRHRCRRKGRCTDAATGLLGHLRGVGGDCADPRWRSRGAAGDGGVHRFPFTIVLLVSVISLIKGLSSSLAGAEAGLAELNPGRARLVPQALARACSCSFKP